jgi:hypothetical protein
MQFLRQAGGSPDWPARPLTEYKPRADQLFVDMLAGFDGT